MTSWWFSAEGFIAADLVFDVEPPVLTCIVGRGGSGWTLAGSSCTSWATFSAWVTQTITGKT